MLPKLMCLQLRIKARLEIIILVNPLVYIAYF